ncbi:hypothetical protein Tco_0376673, partial [Tanacetum coccineum]
MDEIFDQMNNEVNKNTVDKQCAEIEKKNLLIEIENLIVEKKNLLIEIENLIEAPDFNSFFNAKDVTALIEQNDCVKVELEK